MRRLDCAMEKLSALRLDLADWPQRRRAPAAKSTPRRPRVALARAEQASGSQGLALGESARDSIRASSRRRAPAPRESRR